VATLLIMGTYFYLGADLLVVLKAVDHLWSAGGYSSVTIVAAKIKRNKMTIPIHRSHNRNIFLLWCRSLSGAQSG
jgi:hypothetical protein